MANILGIPSPKEDIDGSMVRDVFYEEQDLERILHYCERDVITVAQVFLRLRNDHLLEEEEIKNIWLLLLCLSFDIVNFLNSFL